MMFYSARYYELNNAVSDIGDKEYVALTSEFTPQEIRDIYLNLTAIIEEMEDLELNEILNILENPKNKQKIVVVFEQYINVIDNNKRKIRDAKNAIDALNTENQQKNAELRKLNRNMITIRNEIVEILEKSFKAKFNVSVPTVK